MPKNCLKPVSFFVVLALLSVFSCTKEKMSTIEDDLLPGIDIEPEIELLSVSASQVKAYEDPLVFKIKYLDGDGDLGTEDPDDYTIELVDQRDPGLLIFLYHLSPRAPLNASIAIQGELDIVLDHTILLNAANNAETTTFTLRIRDRAGHWSNTAESGVVTVVE